MRKNLLILLLLMAVSVRADVTHMRVESLTGAEQHFAVARIGKIMFVNDVMEFRDKAGQLLGSTPAGQIAKIVFVEHGEEAIENVSSPAIQIFPNPAQESLCVLGIEDMQTVRIFSMQGGLMLSAEAANGEAQLYVGGLQSGTYLLQIGAQVVKFIKE